jgi:hypothetical protein
VNYKGLDAATGLQRRSIVAYPLFDDNLKFRGAVIWESPLKATFLNTVIPTSFLKGDLPFIQFRVPQHPSQVGNQYSNAQL